MKLVAGADLERLRKIISLDHIVKFFFNPVDRSGKLMRHSDGEEENQAADDRHADENNSIDAVERRE